MQMSKGMDNSGRDPDEAPQYAYWIPDEAVRNLTMERALHGHESHVQLAKRLLDENLPLAVMSIAHMAAQSTDERIRLAASRFIYEASVGMPSKGFGSDVPEGKEPWANVYDSVLIKKELGG
jgi:hypothetical protein